MYMPARIRMMDRTLFYCFCISYLVSLLHITTDHGNYVPKTVNILLFYQQIAQLCKPSEPPEDHQPTLTYLLYNVETCMHL